MIKRYAFQVHGIVQGVGFRPFVYNLATELDLQGWVLNGAMGVAMEIQGDAVACGEFQRRLVAQPPPLARIDDLQITEIDVANDYGFIIRQSATGQRKTLISPDMATCDECLADLNDPHSRMYGYPFVNCTNCGPRFTIIEDIPYDRAKTTMRDFALCVPCRKDFTDPRNRRFHAQPIACPACGPRLDFFYNQDGGQVADPIRSTQEALLAGKIVAVKGLGGYHLACDAQNESAVAMLRRRKCRYDKPFALMVADSDTAARFCWINEQEQALLQSRRRPIVLLRKRMDAAPLAAEIAPHNGRLGVMLPYTPLHHLLLRGLTALVMTSGNVTDEPIAYEDQDAVQRLAGIADCFLTHNRPIFRRCDDSVAIWAAGFPRLYRRSRGYTPEPLRLVGGCDLLAVGGEQKNTFCLVRGEDAFLSQHIGDLDEVNTYDGYRREIADFCRMFEVKPRLLAHDLHPQYLSTIYAKEYAEKQDNPLTLCPVQHHHAHLASVLAEHQLNGLAIGIIFDGTGYGTDGALWGGEILLGDCRSFQRRAHLTYAPLLGGEAAIREPWRMALAYLWLVYGEEKLQTEEFLPWWESGWSLLLAAARQGIQAPLTSGMGRLFDGVAAIAGIGRKVNYEGQAAVALEQILNENDKHAPYFLPLKAQGQEYEIDWRDLIAQAAQDRLAGVAACDISARFHRAVRDMAVAAALLLRRESGVNTVALSGGCWQNVWLLEQTTAMLQQQGFAVYSNQQVPVNDGGLAFGQAAVAAACQ